MPISQVTQDAFPALRASIGQALLGSYHELSLAAYQTVPPRFWSSVTIKTTIEAMLQLSIDAVSTGNYDELKAWVRKSAAQRFETDIIQRLILMLKSEILAKCSLLIDHPSPLIGQMRLQLAEIEQILAPESAPRSRASLNLMHDPVDALVDKIFNEIDGKDYATGEHSRQVAHWCFRIATKLGLSQSDIARVTRGGLIHDIGKIAVPDEILKAPHRLTDEERVVMESHVVVGHEMITTTYPILMDFAVMVRGHHERLDGRGYPDKLTSAEIPLFTRIVTVADCYNAMVGRRPYRKAMSPEFAVKQIREHRGTQFDPDVADAMIDLTNEDNRESL